LLGHRMLDRLAPDVRTTRRDKKRSPHDAGTVATSEAQGPLNNRAPRRL
jgi:hypothetical protein